MRARLFCLLIAAGCLLVLPACRREATRLPNPPALQTEPPAVVLEPSPTPNVLTPKAVDTPAIALDPSVWKRRPGIPVLMYHSVGLLQPADQANRLLQDLTVSPEAFVQQLKWLRDEGYRSVTAAEARALLKEKGPTTKVVCITFDDGYEDNYTQAFPILREHGDKATFFVVTSMLGKPRHMTWDQVIEMQKAGMEIGSHSVTHPDMIKTGNKALEAELKDSKKVLEDKLGAIITDLAYPAGRYDKRVEEATAMAGYEAAWRKDGGLLSSDAPAFALPRLRVSGHLTLEGFKQLLFIASEKQTEPSPKAKTR